MAFTYVASEMQNKFHSSKAPFRFYGGAAGGGKTEALLWEAVYWLDKLEDGNILLARRSYIDLNMNFIKRFLAKVPSALYDYNKTEKTVTWKRTGTVLWFKHCKDDDDAIIAFSGSEFDVELIDEVTQWSEFQLKILWSRLGRRGATVFGCTGNPGGIGHKFIKRVFIDKQLTPEEKEAGYSEEDFEFIPSSWRDNSYLDDKYVKNLSLLPERERKMLRDGDWDNYEGKFFETIKDELHYVPSFEIPRHWKRFRSIDFGRSDPFCCLWYALDETGNVYVYREYYVKNMDVDDNTRAVLTLSEGEKYEYTVADTSIFSQTGFGESIAERMGKLGLPCIAADKRRIPGWTFLKQALSWTPERPPKLRVFKCCVSLIDELTNAQAEDDNPEDLSRKCSDHALDSLRYFIMTVRDYVSPAAPVGEEMHINPEFREYFRYLMKRKAGYNPNKIKLRN